MDFVNAFLRLTDQYGLTNTIQVVILFSAIWLLRVFVMRQNKIALSDAESRKVTTQASADNSTTLTAAINNLATSNNDMGKAMIQRMHEEGLERGKQYAVLTDMSGQVKGLMIGLGDQTKATRGVTSIVSEVQERIMPMQTDLREVNVRTAGFQSSLVTTLDDRLTPMLTLLIGMNNQLGALAASAKASGQNVDTILAEMTKNNQHIAAIISEFALLKDLLFDRDDRVAEILSGQVAYTRGLIPQTANPQPTGPRTTQTQAVSPPTPPAAPIAAAQPTLSQTPDPTKEPTL